MPKLKVKLDIKVKEIEGAEKTPLQEVFLNYLVWAVNTKYEKGLDGQYRRTFARLQRKFDEAIEKDLEFIDIENAELDLIKNAFQDGKLPVHFSKNSLLMEEAIEEAQKDKN